ncbi:MULTISPECIES: DUF1456 family protein [Pseudomonas]|uniref:DUF1456 family protein n=1 Tax=Pseudomonas solani TaxID=2731552 RepID=A0AAU7XXE0_9PSED|nr:MULTISPECIES: DUF1456 family protein [unclassified Pseudomonas]EQM68213.1 hypothetical protein L682_18690 [Pseudomonas alcaligenes OT 69]MDN4148150.1 DUF1456 family protein [Pseudomonas tohonis]MDU9415922.1 DUF1456 family protein [Pseudomonas sp. zfem005]WCD78659.1 DUF1456 family protein [Pseudomonas sp. TUM22785]
MTNNDVLRSLRYLLDISDARVVEIIGLADQEVSRQEVASWLVRDDEEGYHSCSDKRLAGFLDGLVYTLRGKDESRPPLPMELPMSNNQILKKLRVAFELREDDILAILQEADLPMTRAEIGALFRKKDHKNYRACGDQILRNFLRGLTARRRPPQD